MIKLERYTLFKNSLDFDFLIKKSYLDIKNNCSDFDLFVKKTLPEIKKNRSVIIIYENDEPIGYQTVSIKFKDLSFAFTYIAPEKRGNGYSYILREEVVKTFWNETDRISFTIEKNNIASSKGVHKLIKKYNCDFSTEDVKGVNGKKYEKYTITKRSN